MESGLSAVRCSKTPVDSAPVYILEVEGTSGKSWKRCSVTKEFYNKVKCVSILDVSTQAFCSKHISALRLALRTLAFRSFVPRVFVLRAIAVKKFNFRTLGQDVSCQDVGC